MKGLAMHDELAHAHLREESRITSVNEPDPDKASYYERKTDCGKPDYSLLPLDALEGVVRVLEYGCRKYVRDSWRTVPEGRRRYESAMLRHLAAMQRGETVDPESGLRHVDHLATNAIFLAYFEGQVEDACDRR